ncbi:MAG: ABC transporter substrate-binding protein/permease [Bdellovibrionota bacterium]|mgnify:CR=1 FL=1
MKKNICKYLLKISLLVASLLFTTQISAEELRWAADAESGAPYVFYDAKNPTQIIGFEYDLVQILAKKLNRNPRFVQNAWDGLVPGLDREEYDIAINGIEITEDRKKVVLFSNPYYATNLQLVVRQDELRFKNLSDLAGFKVGTLTGALSEKTLRAETGIEILLYESEANAHQDLSLGRSDAVLFDAPIAKYYSEVDSRFKILPTVIGSMTYGIAISKKNQELQKKLNSALQQMIDSGELKEIYERWAIWNSPTAQLFNDTSPTRTPPAEFENYKNNLNSNRGLAEKFKIYKKTFPILATAALKTVQVSFCAMIVAIIGGLVLVGARLYGGSFLRTFVILFVELIRGTPLLLQLFFIFYALPSLGVEFSPFWAAVLGLGINYSVQESEIYRSGLLSVHQNQIEAAKLLGLNSWQSFWSVQAPQAFRISLPPMTTDFIALIKDSSLVSVITMVELTKSYSTLASTYYDYIGFAVIAAILYMLIGLPLVLVSKKLEKSNK